MEEDTNETDDLQLEDHDDEGDDGKEETKTAVGLIQLALNIEEKRFVL
jgi:hypothetical protein